MSLFNRQLECAESAIRQLKLPGWLFGFAVFLAPVPLLAQVYLVDQYTESDGLPSSQVRGMVQSADGRIWFSTRNGIACYDGRNWEIFGTIDGLSEMDQRLLAIDSHQRIWAVSGGPITNISIFENDQWQVLPDRIICQSPFSLLTLEGESLNALVGHNRGLDHIEDGIPRDVEFENSGTPAVFDLERFDDKIYAATEIGLFTVNLHSESELQMVEGSPEVPINALAYDALRNRLWVIGQDWIGTFDGRQWKRLDEHFDDLGSRTNLITTAITGPNGDLFFGTLTGFFSYREQEGIERIGLKNGLVDEGVNGLLFDRDGLLWTSCARGVSKIVSFAFANYSGRDGLFKDEVSAVLHRADGTTVLGHLGGLTIFDGQPVKMISLGPDRTTKVLDIAEDSSGNLWVAGSQAGLFRIAPSGETKNFPISSETRYVNSVLVDQKDQIWVATGSGLFQIENDRFVAQPDSPNLKSDRGIRRLFMNSQGRLVIATGNRGLFRIENDRWQNWSAGDGSLNNSIYAYFERTDDPPMIGTAAGLCTIKGKEIVKLSEPKIDRPVYFIEPDDQNRIWIGTDNGVFRWDGTSLRQLTVEQGLAGRETNRAAGKTDAQGRIWIGTAKGLSIYRPGLDYGPFQPPQVELFRATAGNQSWNPARPYALPHHRNVLTFDYRAISFVDERKIQIRSWMEGLEPGWQVSERSYHWRIHYDFLPPGNYRLHLQAANANGQWSEMASSQLIQILPPFWQTAWFYSVVLIGVAGVGFFTHRFFSQRRYLSRLKREVVAHVDELQQSESRFGVTLESIADGVLTTGLNGEILYMNPAAEQILGQPLKQTRGKKLGEFLATNGCTEKDRNSLMTHVVEGSTWTARLKFVKPDRSVSLIEAGTAPLTNASQKLLGAVVVVRDVTDKVRLQRELDQSQKLASLGTLAGGIAHDFNNVLAVIKWNVSTLQNDAIMPSQQNAIQLIDDAVAQATNLSEQILTFARGGNPRLQSCCLETLIRGSIALFSSEPGLRFELDLPQELWPADVDTVQFNQVLSNLLINASQAMPSGGLISIRARNKTVQAGRLRREVEIEIQDQGAGISQDQLHRVFEPYFTTKTNGFGIGLATCYSIIQKHHGKLSVESRVGVGSTFRIQLPASTTPAQTFESTPQTDQKIQDDCKRILVVDDDELIRKSLVAILKTMKYQVVTVSNGTHALKTYQQELDSGRRFHAVLIDLTMPGLDGRETIQRLRLIDPVVCGVAISGYSDDQVLANYEDYGFVARLQKPCSVQQLQHVLVELANYWPERQEFSRHSK